MGAARQRVSPARRRACAQLDPAQYLTELVSRCSLIVALYEPPGNAACEHDEHAQIVSLMEGAMRGRRSVMDAHLRDLERRICLDRGEHAWRIRANARVA